MIFFIKKIKSQRGYTALMSSVVISAVLILVTLILSLTTIFARFNIFDAENKKVSTALAEACIETALANLAKDKDFNPVAGGDCIGVGDSCSDPNPKKFCKICSIYPDSGAAPRVLGAPVTITTRAVYNQAYTNLSVNANLNGNNFKINNWAEILTVTGCPLP